MGFFLGTQERVRNSRGKRVISIRAIEVLLYFEKMDGFSVNMPRYIIKADKILMTLASFQGHKRT